MRKFRNAWGWLKTMVAKLPKLLPRRRVSEEDPAPGVLTELDKKLGQKIQQRQEKTGRLITTSHGDHNMPKYQPCPKGHGLKRREDKAIVGGIPGALYHCNQCKISFFVKAKGV